MMAMTAIWSYMQSSWPFSVLKFSDSDLRLSDRFVSKLDIPEQTKQFVFAVYEPQSNSVIYLLCAQNLSERSSLDAERLIRVVRPDAVVVQTGHSVVTEIQSDDEEIEYTTGESATVGEPVPTSSFEVLRRCFLYRINKDKYENVAGSLVLRDIFGTSFHGHFWAAKRVAQEVGSFFLLLESPFLKPGEDDSSSTSGEPKDWGGNNFQTLGLQPSSLVPEQMGSTVLSCSRRLGITSELRSQIAKSLSFHLVNSSSESSGDLQPIVDYEAPQFAQSVYTLLVDFHDMFSDIPSIGRALAHAQKMLYDVSQGEMVDTQLLSDVYIFRIAVEGLRIMLNREGRIPINKMGKGKPDQTEFADLPFGDKSHALLAHALRNQTKKFKTTVAIVDASCLAGLRKHWNTTVPREVRDMVDQPVFNFEHYGKTPNHNDRKWSLTDKPVVAVGAGATVVVGVSSLSKVVPASTLPKIVMFKVPASMKIVLTHTQKAIAFSVRKILGLSTTGIASSGVKTTSALKATASAEKLRAVAQGVIASAEKTSLEAMRTAFYEIMRKRRIRPIGFLPWATFGCSVATCTSLLVYGDGIECAVESFPAAPSIASLGRGVQSLHQASEFVKQAEGFRIKKSIESLLYRFQK